MIDKLRQGPKVIRNKVNEVAAAIVRQMNIRGDGLIEVKNTENGIALALNTRRLLPRIPKTGGGDAENLVIKIKNVGTAQIDIYRIVELVGWDITEQCLLATGETVGALKGAEHYAVATGAIASGAVGNAYIDGSFFIYTPTIGSGQPALKYRLLPRSSYSYYPHANVTWGYWVFLGTDGYGYSMVRKCANTPTGFFRVMSVQSASLTVRPAFYNPDTQSWHYGLTGYSDITLYVFPTFGTNTSQYKEGNIVRGTWQGDRWIAEYSTPRYFEEYVP